MRAYVDRSELDMGVSTAPSTPWPYRYACLAELPRQGPFVYAERVGHIRQRRPLLVPCRDAGDRLVGHLAHEPPPSNAALVEVVEDGGSVHLVPTGEPVDRGAVDRTGG